ncbi:hypothetical protein F2Q69_00046127 [Brassica cretica]|uniref:Uncharacterized protein n=1 Tax=Brassica cretica TaxID=69181 RepID=A0A8S9PXK4_BRACR|nr:hypothetical protein F2Q69_00046127 [Brassica cretica]
MMQKMAKELSVVIQVNPGNTGFKVVQEMFAKIEVARAMVLHGIEYCFIPLPLALNLETSDWLRVIIGVESCKAMLELICYAWLELFSVCLSLRLAVYTKTEIVGRLKLLIKPEDWLIQFELKDSALEAK